MRVTESDNLADIFVPHLPASTISFNVSLLLISLVTVFLFWLLVRFYQNPFRIIERQLLAHKISPRDAAHQCVYLIQQGKYSRAGIVNIQTQLDKIRFQKQPPELNQILLLIRSIKHDL